MACFEYFMITSDLIKLKFTNDNSEIERELKNLGIDPLRWAVVEVSDDTITVSVAYECA